METQNTKKQGRRPDYVASIPGNEDTGTRWCEVGIVWKNTRTDSFTLVVNPGVSIAGRVIIMKPTRWSNSANAADTAETSNDEPIRGADLK